MIKNIDSNTRKIVYESDHGAVAQLGERLNGIQEVVGSIPSSSTMKKIAYLLNGKVGFFVFKWSYPETELPEGPVSCDRLKF